VKSRSELIAVFERVLDELYDAHAQLTVNTAESPRLVPSGADVWAEWQHGQAIVTEVREGSDAQRSGIRAGAGILALDDQPIEAAMKARIGRSLRAVDDDVRSWALRAALAGRHNQQRRIQFKIGSAVSNATLPAADQFGNRPARLASRTLPDNIGYIRFHDSLGDSSVIGEFDSELARHRNTAGLVLDLRDTPGGGNTTVARALLGRFVRTERPYQKHVLPSEERETGVRRSWLELVTPRGPFRYPSPVVVLVGHWTGSMGEGIAIGFDAVEAATIVGTPMAQLLGATDHFELPQSHFGVNIPSEKLFHVNGTPREAFVPPVRVTLQELSEPDGDPWMTKAMQVFNEQRR
jgi:carboxyl-terminal processing protease